MKTFNFAPLVYSLLLTASVVGMTGCAALNNAKDGVGDYILDEFGLYHEGKSQKKTDTLIYHSDYAKDYIFKDSPAIAVPAVQDWDLYISPYAPTKYFRSKDKPGTTVIDPYSNKPVILGDRKYVKEHDVL